MTEAGYFLVADILGFSAVIANTAEGRIDQRIQQWASLVESARAQCGIMRCQLFSDTVFAAVPSSEDGLKCLVAFARELLTDGLKQSFLVRGGIAHGSFLWGPLIYGRAVIEAHELESRQNWIGVACQGGLPHVKNLWGWDQLVCYLPPMKSGRMQAQPVVSWRVPNSTRFTELVMLSEAVRDGEPLTWEVGAKMDNTLLFRSYLLVARQEGLDPSVFHGPLPSQALDEALTKRAYGNRVDLAAAEEPAEDRGNAG